MISKKRENTDFSVPAAEVNPSGVKTLYFQSEHSGITVEAMPYSKDQSRRHRCKFVTASCEFESRKEQTHFLPVPLKAYLDQPLSPRFYYVS